MAVIQKSARSLDQAFLYYLYQNLIVHLFWLSVSQPYCRGKTLFTGNLLALAVLRIIGLAFMTEYLLMIHFGAMPCP